MRQRSAKSIAATKDHSHWGRAFNVLEHHVSTAVLIEAGFATNDDDRARMRSPWGQQVVVASIARGVVHWLEAFPVKVVV